MKNSLKGALLSGLLFPGSGQLKLKRYGKGIALILIVTSSVCIFFVKAVQKAFMAIEKLQSEGDLIDIDAISKAAAQASTASDDLIMNFSLLLIVICWIIGIVDAYLTGKRMDSEMQESESKEIL